MTPKLRIATVIIVSAIVAASCIAVYTFMFPDRVSDAHRFASMRNFIALASPKQVPEVTFLDERGQSMTLSHFKGKVIVLNLWATWCTPCVAEMPLLDQLQQKLGEDDVVVLALSIDRGGPTTVREFFDRNGVKHLKVYVDPAMRAQSILGTTGLPTTIIIDRQGLERGRLSGPAEWNSTEAVEMIESFVSDTN